MPRRISTQQLLEKQGRWWGQMWHDLLCITRSVESNKYSHMLMEDPGTPILAQGARIKQTTDLHSHPLYISFISHPSWCVWCEGEMCRYPGGIEIGTLGTRNIFQIGVKTPDAPTHFDSAAFGKTREVVGTNVTWLVASILLPKGKKCWTMNVWGIRVFFQRRELRLTQDSSMVAWGGWPLPEAQNGHEGPWEIPFTWPFFRRHLLFPTW